VEAGEGGGGRGALAERGGLRERVFVEFSSFSFQLSLAFLFFCKLLSFLDLYITNV
jgi:hypothetical protein